MKYLYSIVFALVVFLSAASFANAQSALTYNLKLGMRADAQVVTLQNFLMSKGFLGSGNGTGNFGPLTFSAVRTYQSTNGIVEVTETYNVFTSNLFFYFWMECYQNNADCPTTL